jgi:hypothetical protein
LTVGSSLPGIAPSHIGHVTGSIAVRIQAVDVPESAMSSPVLVLSVSGHLATAPGTRTRRYGRFSR